MQDSPSLVTGAELADAIFQAAITAGLAGLALVLYRRIRERWLAWWAAAWALYVVRLGAIIAFLATGDLAWLFWHQVVTGWVALAILWAALVFSRNLAWRPGYLALAAFPVLLGWIAITGLDRLVVVAIPMLLLIGGATLWTGLVFWRHAARTGSAIARFVAVAFVLWGLHHFDYPFLRARGAWEPWGYFLDIAFELAVGIGFALLVLSDVAARLADRTSELARLQQRRVRQDERDRQRLARDLHDESAQTFSAVRLEIAVLREDASPTTRAQLDRVLERVDDGIRGVRRVINDLRPSLLDDLGLGPAIRALGEQLRSRRGLTVNAAIADHLPRLGDDAELGLFRTAQEALANVIRHADATQVTIRLATEGELVVLAIADDGRGFPPGATLATFERDGHLGLVGMRERIAALGGTLRVDGSDGTRLTVRIPAPRVNGEW